MKWMFLILVSLYTINIFGQIEFNQTDTLMETGCYEMTHVYEDLLFTYSRNKLEMYDITDPVNPVLKDQLKYPGMLNGYKYFAFDDKLYVSREWSEILEVFDISDGENIELIYSKTFTPYSFIGVTDNYIINFIPTGSDELFFYERLTGDCVGSYTDEYSPFREKNISGNFLIMEENMLWYIYMVGDTPYVRILDCEDFSSISEIDNKPYEELKINNYKKNYFHHRQDTLFVTVPCYDIFYTYKFGQDSLSLVSIIGTVGEDGVAGEAAMNDSIFIYELQGDGSLVYYNISDLYNPVFLKRSTEFITLYRNNKIGLKDEIMYLCINYDGFRIVDISDVDDIVICNVIHPYDYIDFNYLKYGDYYYFRSFTDCNSPYTFFPNSTPALDLTDINNPVVFEYGMDNFPRGNLNYSEDKIMKSAWGQSDVYDLLNDPRNPVFKFTVDGLMFHYSEEDSTGYFLEDGYRIQKYKVVDGEREFCYSLDLSGDFYHDKCCEKFDDYLFIGGFDCSMLSLVYDTGSEFMDVNSFYTDGAYRYQNHTFVGDNSLIIVYNNFNNAYKFKEYDISDPLLISEVNSRVYYPEDCSIITDLNNNGSYLTLCTISKPVAVFDLSLNYVGNLTEKAHWSIEFHDDTHFLAKDHMELGIYEYSINSITNEIKVTQKKSVPQISNYPNPFNPSTSIDLDIGSDFDFADINIYNAKGQLIKSYDKITLSDGRASIVWDGKNDAGDSASSGVYFYQVVAGDKPLGTRKMIMLK